MKINRVIFLVLALIISGEVVANSDVHFTCDFDRSVFVDSSGIYEAEKWSSKGFSIKGDFIVLDSGNLKLNLTTNIDKFGTIILRGGEPKKGYQFSLENEKFIYVQLIIPLARSWTVTGTCRKD